MSLPFSVVVRNNFHSFNINPMVTFSSFTSLHILETGFRLNSILQNWLVRRGLQLLIYYNLIKSPVNISWIPTLDKNGQDKQYIRRKIHNHITLKLWVENDVMFSYVVGSWLVFWISLPQSVTKWYQSPFRPSDQRVCLDNLL